ncbi:MATE family efflux transporter [Mesosutterella porci]|uniref:MATE family efflux transporter n=1 Tax=Mesosutterella porci TaxID=2915351 RepID=UPI0024B5B0C1|nr:MATE family efflux transporter [Mesosutterella sp. oilRF-744-WT-GAM-9]
MTENITQKLVSRIRTGGSFTRSEELALVVRLSLPAIVAQIAAVMMQYIDAAMVGNLGAVEAAAVGLVASTTWLFWGLGSAGLTGYTVLASHRIGARGYRAARSLLRQGFVVALATGLILGGAGLAISPFLPEFLGASSEVAPEARVYFALYTAAFPIFFLSAFAGGMLRASGNIRVPSLLSVLMCLEDVVFNFLLIFPTREVQFAGLSFMAPGAGLGVAGAAIGTVLAEFLTALPMLWFVCTRSPELRIRGERGRFRPEAARLKQAFRIGIPIGCQHTVMCCAQVASTMIVAPLGTVALAANSLAITAEGLCYMPGYGIADAASSLTGQCIGARRPALARRFAYLTVGSGIAVMTLMGAFMYAAAPFMMGLMSNVDAIIDLGSSVLRIEAFAEPMFAASIVAYGVFMGAGDTLAPCLMNLGSMWLVRIPAAWLLSQSMGLRGVWIAMCGELILRGLIFLARLRFGNWQKEPRS